MSEPATSETDLIRLALADHRAREEARHAEELDAYRALRQNASDYAKDVLQFEIAPDRWSVTGPGTAINQVATTVAGVNLVYTDAESGATLLAKIPGVADYELEERADFGQVLARLNPRMDAPTPPATGISSDSMFGIRGTTLSG